MLRLLLVLALVAWPRGGPAQPAPLMMEVVSGPKMPDGPVIVGRSVCGGVSWLLTDTGMLIRVLPVARQVSTVPIRDARSRDRPWGLACLDDGSLWTLADARVLARVGADGRMVARHELPQPWFALFGIDNRLLYEPLPPATGKPLLAAVAPAQLLTGKPWVGLVAQRGATDRPQDFPNYVNCGIRSYKVTPCWFANQSQVVLSDGVNARHVTVDVSRHRTAAPVDASAPIRDVALAAPGRMWVLMTTMGVGAKREGRWLMRTTTARGGGDEMVELDPPARLILAATDERCVLLNVRGELVEVRPR